MAELGLDQVNRVALRGQLGGVGVAKTVGMHALVDPRLACEAGEEATDVGGVQRFAFEGAEDGAAVEAAKLGHPGNEHRAGLGIDPDRPGLVALPVQDADRALFAGSFSQIVTLSYKSVTVWGLSDGFCGVLSKSVTISLPTAGDYGSRGWPSTGCAGFPRLAR